MSANVRNTKTQSGTGIEPYHKAAFDAYLTFCALGGIITTDTGKLETMTQEEFCDIHGIDSRTCRRWKKDIPNFGDLVRERRSEIVPLARETAVWNRLYLLSMQNQDKRAAVDAAKTILGHFGKMELPTQRTTVEAGENLMDLFKSVEERRVIEGETVDAPDSGTSGDTAGSLPSASE